MFDLLFLFLSFSVCKCKFAKKRKEAVSTQQQKEWSKNLLRHFIY